MGTNAILADGTVAALEGHDFSTGDIVRSFAIAYGTVFVLALLAFFAARIAGVTEVVATMVAGSFLTLVKSLQERVERSLRRKANVAVPESSPTITPLRMLFYAPSVVMGSYLAVIVSAIAIAAALMASGIRGGVVVGVYGVTTIVGSASLPVVCYFIGEWIGRRAGGLVSALAVAAVSPSLLAVSAWIVMRLSLASTAPENLDPMAQLMVGTMQTWLPTILAGQILCTVWVPVLVGAYRGSVYKRYFDLAFFVRKAGRGTRREIDEFVDMVARQYYTTTVSKLTA